MQVLQRDCEEWIVGVAQDVDAGELRKQFLQQLQSLGLAALTGLRKSGSVACKPSWLLVSDIARDSMRVEARGESWLLTLRADLALSERGEQ